MPRDVVLHGALLEGTGTQMDKPLRISVFLAFIGLEVLGGRHAVGEGDGERV